MGASFVGATEHYDASTAWPTSLTILSPPAGTSRGDRLILDVFSYGNPTELDNHNLGSSWTLLTSGNSVLSSVRSSVFRYTARYDDGIFPITVTPSLIDGNPTTVGTWYRAVLSAVTVSHPNNFSKALSGSSTSNQPENGGAGFSGDFDDFLLQTTMLLNPTARSFGSIISTSVATMIDVATFPAVAGRGNEIRVAGGLSTGAFSGLGTSLYPLNGSGGSIAVRGVLTALDAQPDDSLWIPRTTFL